MYDAGFVLQRMSLLTKHFHILSFLWKMYFCLSALWKEKDSCGHTCGKNSRHVPEIFISISWKQLSVIYNTHWPFVKASFDLACFKSRGCHLHGKVLLSAGEKSDNKTLDLIKATSTACYLWDRSISLFPGRNGDDGRQKCPLCLVKISSVWSVNADTKPLGRVGEGGVSHYGNGLGSLLPLCWPLTMAGFQGCAGSQSSEAVSALIGSWIVVRKIRCFTAC